MSPRDAARALEQVARDLDLVTYTLERSEPADPNAAVIARRRLRQELDALRVRIEDLSRSLDSA